MLVLGEVAVRLTARITHRVPLVVSDAQAGWALQPSLRDQIRAGHGGQYVISTDEEGHRLTRLADERSAGLSPAVILVGDSFVQGQFVNDSETFAWVLAQETSLNVVNLGVLGYGTDQELVSLAAYLEAHPTLPVRDIVVVVFDNDFIDVQLPYHPAVARSRPSFRVTNGRLEPVGYRLRFSDHLMDYSYLYWLLNSKWSLIAKEVEPDSVEGVEVVHACVAAMRDLATRRGAHFHVLAHRNLSWRRPFSDSQWADFVYRSGATDITPGLMAMKEAAIAYDGGHWSPAGHGHVATIVKALLKQEGSASKSAPCTVAKDRASDTP
jgi:hypothetical protein